MGQKSTELPVPIYDVSNVPLTSQLDTGIYLLQEGKSGWCVYVDMTNVRTSDGNLSTSSSLLSYYGTFWYWARTAGVVGCSGRMTSDIISQSFDWLKTAILNANFETMKFDVILNNGENIRPTQTIPDRVNSTASVTFGPNVPRGTQTINRLVIWDCPLTESQIKKVFKQYQ